jgi:hypothetical protein
MANLLIVHEKSPDFWDLNEEKYQTMLMGDTSDEICGKTTLNVMLNSLFSRTEPNPYITYIWEKTEVVWNVIIFVLWVFKVLRMKIF